MKTYLPFSSRSDHCSLCLLLVVVLRACSIANCRCDNYQSQCAYPGGPAQYSSLGTVTCFNNGLLSVSINLHSNWSRDDKITVYYTCWSQERNNTVGSGIIPDLENALFDVSSGWRNANGTVNIMDYQGATCTVYSCYIYQVTYPEYITSCHGIAMTNSECSFGSVGHTTATPVTSAHPFTGSSDQASFISPKSTSLTTLSMTSTDHPEVSPTITTHDSNHPRSTEISLIITSSTKASQIPFKSTVTTSMKLTSHSIVVNSTTGVPLPHDSQSGLKVILPVILLSVVGVVVLTVILLCFIGYKHLRLRSMKVYITDDVFNPYFYPVDIGKQLNMSAAQSIHSVYDSLRSNNSDDYGTEDEKSEILDSTMLSDHNTSNISIVIGEDTNIQQKGNEDNTSECSVIRAQQEIVGISDVAVPHQSFNNAIKEPGQEALNTVPHKCTNRSFSHSSNSSGYVTESESSPLSYPPLVMQDKQSGYVLESGAEQFIQGHENRGQVLVHNNSRTDDGIQSCNTQLEVVGEQDIEDSSCFEEKRESFVWEDNSNVLSIAERGSVKTDNGLEGVHLFIPTNGLHDSLLSTQTVSYDVIPECSLSLNPSHFEPLDYV